MGNWRKINGKWRGSVCGGGAIIEWQNLRVSKAIKVIPFRLKDTGANWTAWKDYWRTKWSEKKKVILDVGVRQRLLNAIPAYTSHGFHPVLNIGHTHTSIVFRTKIWWWIAHLSVSPIFFIQGPTGSCGEGFCTQETLTKLPRSPRDPLVV